MTLDAIRDQNRARPFRPFVIHMADGRKFRIVHPDFLGITGHRTVFVGRVDSDGFDILDAMLVTGIEVIDSKQKRNGRGRGKAA